MALTFRTGSGGKDSALTIEELDNNFRHFTGSHSVTGSLGVTGSLEVIGNITASGDITAANFETVGKITAEISVITPVIKSTTDALQVFGNLDVVSHITASGNISASGDLYGNEIFADNKYYTNGLLTISNNGVKTFFGIPTQPTEIQGTNIKFDAPVTGLPTTEPLVTGSLWLSGSGAGNASGSKYLMVFNG